MTTKAMKKSSSSTTIITATTASAADRRRLGGDDDDDYKNNSGNDDGGGGSNEMMMRRRVFDLSEEFLASVAGADAANEYIMETGESDVIARLRATHASGGIRLYRRRVEDYAAYRDRRGDALNMALLPPRRQSSLSSSADDNDDDKEEGGGGDADDIGETTTAANEEEDGFPPTPPSPASRRRRIYDINAAVADVLEPPAVARGSSGISASQIVAAWRIGRGGGVGGVGTTASSSSSAKAMADKLGRTEIVEISRGALREAFARFIDVRNAEQVKLLESDVRALVPDDADEPPITMNPRFLAVAREWIRGTLQEGGSGGGGVAADQIAAATPLSPTTMHALARAIAGPDRAAVEAAIALVKDDAVGPPSASDVATVLGYGIFAAQMIFGEDRIAITTTPPSNQSHTFHHHHLPTTTTSSPVSGSKRSVFDTEAALSIRAASVLGEPLTSVVRIVDVAEDARPWLIRNAGVSVGGVWFVGRERAIRIAVAEVLLSKGGGDGGGKRAAPTITDDYNASARALIARRLSERYVKFINDRVVRRGGAAFREFLFSAAAAIVLSDDDSNSGNAFRGVELDEVIDTLSSAAATFVNPGLRQRFMTPDAARASFREWAVERSIGVKDVHAAAAKFAANSASLAAAASAVRREVPVIRSSSLNTVLIAARTPAAFGSRPMTSLEVFASASATEDVPFIHIVEDVEMFKTRREFSLTQSMLSSFFSIAVASEYSDVSPSGRAVVTLPSDDEPGFDDGGQFSGGRLGPVKVFSSTNYITARGASNDIIPSETLLVGATAGSIVVTVAVAAASASFTDTQPPPPPSSVVNRQQPPPPRRLVYAILERTEATGLFALRFDATQASESEDMDALAASVSAALVAAFGGALIVPMASSPSSSSSSGSAATIVRGHVAIAAPWVSLSSLVFASSADPILRGVVRAADETKLTLSERGVMAFRYSGGTFRIETLRVAPLVDVNSWIVVSFRLNGPDEAAAFPEFACAFFERSRALVQLAGGVPGDTNVVVSVRSAALTATSTAPTSAGGGGGGAMIARAAASSAMVRTRTIKIKDVRDSVPANALSEHYVTECQCKNRPVAVGADELEAWAGEGRPALDYRVAADDGGEKKRVGFFICPNERTRFPAVRRSQQSSDIGRAEVLPCCFSSEVRAKASTQKALGGDGGGGGGDASGGDGGGGGGGGDSRSDFVLSRPQPLPFERNGKLPYIIMQFLISETQVRIGKQRTLSNISRVGVRQGPNALLSACIAAGLSPGWGSHPLTRFSLDPNAVNRMQRALSVGETALRARVWAAAMEDGGSSVAQEFPEVVYGPRLDAIAATAALPMDSTTCIRALEQVIGANVVVFVAESSTDWCALGLEVPRFANVWLPCGPIEGAPTLVLLRLQTSTGLPHYEPIVSLVTRVFNEEDGRDVTEVVAGRGDGVGGGGGAAVRTTPHPAINTNNSRHKRTEARGGGGSDGQKTSMKFSVFPYSVARNVHRFLARSHEGVRLVRLPTPDRAGSAIRAYPSATMTTAAMVLSIFAGGGHIKTQRIDHYGKAYEFQVIIAAMPPGAVVTVATPALAPVRSIPVSYETGSRTILDDIVVNSHGHHHPPPDMSIFAAPRSVRIEGAVAWVTPRPGIEFGVYMPPPPITTTTVVVRRPPPRQIRGGGATLLLAAEDIAAVGCGGGGGASTSMPMAKCQRRHLDNFFERRRAAALAVQLLWWARVVVRAASAIASTPPPAFASWFDSITKPAVTTTIIGGPPHHHYHEEVPAPTSLPSELPVDSDDIAGVMAVVWPDAVRDDGVFVGATQQSLDALKSFLERADSATAGIERTLANPRGAIPRFLYGLHREPIALADNPFNAASYVAVGAAAAAARPQRLCLNSDNGPSSFSLNNRRRCRGGDGLLAARTIYFDSIRRCADWLLFMVGRNNASTAGEIIGAGSDACSPDQVFIRRGLRETPSVLVEVDDNTIISVSQTNNAPVQPNNAYGGGGGGGGVFYITPSRHVYNDGVKPGVGAAAFAFASSPLPTSGAATRSQGIAAIYTALSPSWPTI